MKFIIAILIAGMLTSAVSASEDTKGKSYIPHEQAFPLIEDKNRRAEAWATCAAIYRVMSKITDSPNEATQYNNTANGAEVAVLMTFITAFALADSREPSKFYATLEYATTLKKAMPEAQLTTIMSDFENQEFSVWANNVSATLLQCTENIKYQQIHIDTFREMMMSGLLK